jgi:nitrate reductase (NAD(P)H)
VAAAPPAAPPAGARLITLAELEQHDSKASAWFAVDGKVYDATPFLKEHPGETREGRGAGAGAKGGLLLLF